MRKNNNTPKTIVGLPILRGKKFIPKVLSIFIEISGRCNAKCPYCARQRFKQRYSGKNMSPVLFEQILDHLLDIDILHRDHNPTILLYNWGEPFLNPGINDILKILKEKKLYAGISSNFILKPEVDKDNLQVISEVTFSLSGFSQDSYGKIHGASLNRVLDNFEDFYDKIRAYAPNTKIRIAWHRYIFNEREFWEAYKYFDRPGINFNPAVAYLNDLSEMLNYAERGLPGVLSEDRQRQVEADLFFNYISQKLAYHRQRSKHYQCFMWKYLVIDEIGQLLLCCGMTNDDLDHILGNVLEMSAEEIWQKKLSDSICKRCILSGLPRALSSIDYKPLPPGGGIGGHFELWYQINLSKVVSIIRDLPMGEKIIRMIKKIKN
ncbi:MAG: radical SAM protein [Thermodesulfobacteriota bacterium]